MRAHALGLVVALFSACQLEGELVPASPPPRIISADQFAGRALDFTTGAPIAGANVRTVGLGHELESYGTTDDAGEFLLDKVPAGSRFRIRVELSGYAPTNSRLLQNNGEQAADTFAISKAALEAQYTALGQEITLGQSTLLAELVTGEGAGKDGILADQMGLAPLGGSGPYFYGAVTPPVAGSSFALKEGLAAELDDQGRAIVGYLNLPVGQYEFRAVYGMDTKKAAFVSLANEVVMVRVNDPLLP
jgi:hypothetical protein